MDVTNVRTIIDGYIFYNFYKITFITIFSFIGR